MWLAERIVLIILALTGALVWLVLGWGIIKGTVLMLVVYCRMGRKRARTIRTSDWLNAIIAPPDCLDGYYWPNKAGREMAQRNRLAYGPDYEMPGLRYYQFDAHGKIIRSKWRMGK